MSLSIHNTKSPLIAAGAASLALETALISAQRDGLSQDIAAVHNWEKPLATAWQAALGGRDALAMASAWQMAIQPDYFGLDNLLHAAQQAIAASLHDSPIIATERAIARTLECLAWDRMRQGVHDWPACLLWAGTTFALRLAWALAPDGRAAGKGRLLKSLASLGPVELIAIIEEAQRLLDDKHPLNPTELKCPQCGHSDHLRMEVYHWADWEPDGASVDTDCDPAWGAESACNCPECEFTGRVVDFINSSI